MASNDRRQGVAPYGRAVGRRRCVTTKTTPSCTIHTSMLLLWWQSMTHNFRWILKYCNSNELHLFGSRRAGSAEFIHIIKQVFQIYNKSVCFRSGLYEGYLARYLLKTIGSRPLSTEMKPRWLLNVKHKHGGGTPRAFRTVIVCTPKLKPAEEALHGNKRETLKETIKINVRRSSAADILKWSITERWFLRNMLPFFH